MKYALTPTPLCRHRDRTDAACRGLARCRRCGCVLRVYDHAPDRCNACRSAQASKRGVTK